ncbi:transposable element Tcb2 transposase [Trichonephila clavipes]|nr:transposable element Tcb2 transposase [Trichonephila clavipes]
MRRYAGRRNGGVSGSIKHVVGEQLSGGSVVVVPEEPHPQMIGTLSYRPEETGGRQREKNARHTTQATGRPISRLTVARRLHGGGLFARRPVRAAMGLQFLFMDDNAPCHRTVAAEQLLESEYIERMDWPARSPDVNPIQHVWDFLGRRLAARTLPPVTIRELQLALQDEWAAMPQQLIDTLILSMGRRCETCLAVREIISPTEDRMFLAGPSSQGCFGLQSHCAPCYFFNIKLLFIPLISF